MMDAIMLVIAMLNDVKTRQIKLYEELRSPHYRCIKADYESPRWRNVMCRYYRIEGEIDETKKEIKDLEKLLKDLEGRFNEKENIL